MMALKAFWWNKAANFGDGINPDIISYVSGREVEWASPEACEFVAIGSVMMMIATAVRDKAGPIKYVWGSGLFGPAKIISDFSSSNHVRVSLTRGPLSALFCGHENVPYGDPGLVADRVYGQVEKTSKIGFVPHHSQWKKVEFIESVMSNDCFEIIDVRHRDPATVVRKIAACEYIISCSLHGLIIADAYRIPSFWAKGPELGQSNLKYFDYGLSIGRSLSSPQTIDSCLEDIDKRRLERFWYFDDLEAAKDCIVGSFPEDLKA